MGAVSSPHVPQRCQGVSTGCEVRCAMCSNWALRLLKQMNVLLASREGLPGLSSDSGPCADVRESLTEP